MEFVNQIYSNFSFSFATELVSWTLMLYGCFLIITSSIGILRMPDLFTKFHAASISDSLGIPLLLIGIAIQYGFSLEGAKIILLVIIVYLVNPTATYALARAATEQGQQPLKSEKGKKDD